VANTLKNWFNNFKFIPSKIDFVLLGCVLFLSCFGLLMVYSSSFIFASERTGDGYYFIKRQFIFFIFGLMALRIGIEIPIEWIKKNIIPITVFSLGLLVIVLIPGVGARVGGAQRWLRLGLFNVQPGEIAKFGMILFSSYQLSRPELNLLNPKQGLTYPLIAPAIAVLLLLLQPDFGTCVMILLSVGVLMFMGGVTKKYLFGLSLLGFISGLILVLSTSYRRARLMTFLDPWRDPTGKGFQVLQSMLGVYQGGIFGTGLGNSKEKLFYLPEAHNDFIFAVIGEELGLMGVMLVVCCYLFFIYRGLKVAQVRYRDYQDVFGSLVAAGITLSLGLQAFINISVVLGLVPTKGLTLPFISYGGSALFINLFEIGILLSLSKPPYVKGSL
jgi:cell division protein FtsW